jgi:hypothetical protein
MYTNLIYNEFLYYSLFVKYYNNVILNNPNLATSDKKNNYNLAVNYLKNNAYEFNRAVNASQK